MTRVTYLHHHGPILITPAVDLLRAVQKLDVGHLHPARLPHLDHVLTHLADLLQIPTELVVHLRKPISDPECERAATARQLVDVLRLKQTLRDVHPPARLEAIVANRTETLCCARLE